MVTLVGGTVGTIGSPKGANGIILINTSDLRDYVYILVVLLFANIIMVMPFLKFINLKFKTPY